MLWSLREIDETQQENNRHYDEDVWSNVVRQIVSNNEWHQRAQIDEQDEERSKRASYAMESKLIIKLIFLANFI